MRLLIMTATHSVKIPSENQSLQIFSLAQLSTQLCREAQVQHVLVFKHRGSVGPKPLCIH